MLNEVQGLCVDVSYLIMGPLENNVYVISDGAGAVVVDPSCEVDRIMGALRELGISNLDAIVLTHSHWDHVDAAADLRAATGARVIASAVDAEQIERPTHDSTSRVATPCVVDQRVSHGDIVEVGNMKWKVMATPGHTKGSMCLFIVPHLGNHADGLPVLISGDTLFAGTVGRTDFEGGSMADMTASVKKLAFLPDDTVVLPGHSSLTTIGAERRRVFARFGWEPEE